MNNLDRSTLRDAQTVDYVDSSSISGHKVLRNTYMLLSMTLLFSAIAAGVSIAFALPSMGIIVTLIGYFGLLFLTAKLRNSAWGIASVFALTGFMGLTLGPIISRYLGMPGGSGIVMNAMGLTAVIFMGLSAYVLVSKRDFSFMGGFLAVGVLVAFVAGLGAIFFEIPALSIAATRFE